MRRPRRRATRPRHGRAAPGWLLAVAVFLPLVPVSGAAASGCTAGSGLALSLTQPNRTAPSTVSFQLTDPDGAPLWVNWSFGDGDSVNRTGSTLLSVSHLYETVGSYMPQVRVDQGSGLLTCTTSVTVAPAPFSVTIRATPSNGPAPLTVAFTAVLTGGSGTYDAAVWTFGDGRGATGFNVTETYEVPGSYTASLSVFDSAGQNASADVKVTVGSPSGPSNGSGGSPDAWIRADLPLLALAAVGILIVAGLVGVARARGRAGKAFGRSAAGGGSTGAEAPPSLGAASIPAAPPSPEATPPGEEAGPMAGSDAVGETFSVPPGPESSSSEEPGPGVPTDAPRRLRLSQRVLLHLYRQGHLADGEVAPIAFTQAGMSSALEVAQSPLSSVLRRLVVAGLVVQDTRHVRGQPRRLRVYRLTGAGEAVARDLYRSSVDAPSEAGPEP